MSLFSDIVDDIVPLLQKSSGIHATYKTALLKKLHAMGIRTAGDILMHVPASYENRKGVISLSQSARDEKVLVHARVESHAFVRLRRGRLLKIALRDESGCAELHCYGREFLQHVLRVGSTAVIWGKFTYSYGSLSASDFEVIRDPTRENTIVPRYTLYNTGISQSMFSLCIKTVLEFVRIPHLRELPRNSLLNWYEHYNYLHILFGD